MSGGPRSSSGAWCRAAELANSDRKGLIVQTVQGNKSAVSVLAAESSGFAEGHGERETPLKAGWVPGTLREFLLFG